MKSNNVYFRGFVVKLIIANVVIFALQIFSIQYQVIYNLSGVELQYPVIMYYLGLIPGLIAEQGYLWQIFTYMFLHSTYGFAHIFFNMYALLLFGTPIEQEWGSRRFLLYYLFCGTGAGLSIFLINLITGGSSYYVPTIGASGAVFGLLLAFGILYPNAEILIFFIIPLKAKYLVILYGGLELYMELFGGQSSISHMGHLGGLLFGIFYFVIFRRSAFAFRTKILKSRIQGKLNSFTSPHAGGRASPDEADRNIRGEIIRKLREQGPDSLNDDEVQYIKYLDIMAGDDALLCPEGDYEMDDSRCTSCERNSSCFLREVKKYLSMH